MCRLAATGKACAEVRGPNRSACDGLVVVRGAEMPLAAERALIGFALAFDAGEAGGVEGVALRAVAAFACAHAALFFARGLFHASGAKRGNACVASERERRVRSGTRGENANRSGYGCRPAGGAPPGVISRRRFSSRLRRPLFGLSHHRCRFCRGLSSCGRWNSGTARTWFCRFRRWRKSASCF